MRTKVAYRIKNWSQYNRSLVDRGNITLWLSDEAIEGWYAQNQDPRRGRPFFYSNSCIELGLTIRSLFRLPLRATQGFLEGLLGLLGKDLPVPDYTSFSRRAAELKIDLSSVRDKKEKIDIVVDSTGLKIYGEGEWKVRTHGKDKRRTWRKMHLASNAKGLEIVAIELTAANVHDCMASAVLIESQKNIGTVYGDGAYTAKRTFDAIASIGAKASIAIRSGTSIVAIPSPGEEDRNRIVNEIHKAGGRKEWKKTSGYHRRSLAETQMFRFKQILGEKLASRNFANQVVEARLKASILNRMAQLGMPESRRVQ